jgi:hypothetical protein
MSERFTLTQEHIEMLNSRRAVDAQFGEFMQDSDARVNRLEKAVARLEAVINEMHTALFAKDDTNEYGVTGLMVNMQRIVRHTEVVCNIARFFKWCVVGVLGIVTPFLAALHYLGWV